MTEDSHPEELLDAWHAGELAPGDQARLMAHARDCVSCRLELEVAPGLDAETEAEPGDEAKMAAMIGAAMVELPQSPGGPGAPGEPATTGIGPSGKLAWLGTGVAVASALVIAIVIGGEAQAPAPTPTPAAATTSDIGEPDPEPAAAPEPEPQAEAAPEAETEAAPEPEAEPEADTEAAPEPAPSAEPTAEAPAAPTPVVPDAATLLREANAERRAKHYARAADVYERLRKHHRGSDEEILARVTYGTMLLDHLDRPRDALRHFDAYLGARPDGTLAEEALTGRAKALRRLGKAKKEREAWRTLLSRYPDSAYADLARQRIGE